MTLITLIYFTSLILLIIAIFAYFIGEPDLILKNANKICAVILFWPLLLTICGIIGIKEFIFDK